MNLIVGLCAVPFVAGLAVLAGVCALDVVREEMGLE